MWKNFKNVVGAVSDLVVIAGKEVVYQAEKASEATEAVTSKISKSASTIRSTYEQNLKDRKAGIKKPEVVTESEVATETVAIN